MKILVFDNYDSFTYNLVHMLEKVSDHTIDVIRNDKISLEDIGKYDRILISPGPGLPAESGILIDMIKTYAGKKPILGVCLGQQAIAEAFGGNLINLPKVFHGVATEGKIIEPDELLNGIPEKFQVGRYHSWVVDKKTLPGDFIITMEDEEGNIMAIKHKTMNLRGVQFHPESVLTEHGEEIIKNWLEYC